DGDASKFKLGVEAARLGLAYEYDPYFSLSIARIDPLPHQLEPVYDYFLKLPLIRFRLADDPGPGKTIMAVLLFQGSKITRPVPPQPAGSRCLRRYQGPRIRAAQALGALLPATTPRIRRFASRPGARRREAVVHEVRGPNGTLRARWGRIRLLRRIDTLRRGPV